MKSDFTHLRQCDLSMNHAPTASLKPKVCYYVHKYPVKIHFDPYNREPADRQSPLSRRISTTDSNQSRALISQTHCCDSASSLAPPTKRRLCCIYCQDVTGYKSQRGELRGNKLIKYFLIVIGQIKFIKSTFKNFLNIYIHFNGLITVQM